MRKSGNPIRTLAVLARGGGRVRGSRRRRRSGPCEGTPAPRSPVRAARSCRRSSRPWIPAVGAAYGYELQYSAIGSSGGINAITGRTVDFGASDAPLTPDQFTACNGCEQIPWALGATSIMYNLPGVKNLLHMDGPTLAKIFMGKITTWNDPAIAKLNPGVSLPTTKITIAHRSDGSGTTFNLTDYLSSVSPAWSLSDRQGHERELAGRRRRQGQLGRLGDRRPDAGRDRLCRRRVRAEEPLQLLRDEEPLRQVHDAGICVGSSRPPPATRSRRRTTRSRS